MKEKKFYFQGFVSVEGERPDKLNAATLKSHLERSVFLDLDTEGNDLNLSKDPEENFLVGVSIDWESITPTNLPELVKSIAGQLSGIHEDDLTTAERQISNLLLKSGYLIKDETGDLRPS